MANEDEHRMEDLRISWDRINITVSADESFDNIILRKYVKWNSKKLLKCTKYYILLIIY